MQVSEGDVEDRSRVQGRRAGADTRRRAHGAGVHRLPACWPAAGR